MPPPTPVTPSAGADARAPPSGAAHGARRPRGDRRVEATAGGGGGGGGEGGGRCGGGARGGGARGSVACIIARGGGGGGDHRGPPHSAAAGAECEGVRIAIEARRKKRATTDRLAALESQVRVAGHAFPSRPAALADRRRTRRQAADAPPAAALAPARRRRRAPPASGRAVPGAREVGVLVTTSGAQAQPSITLSPQMTRYPPMSAPVTRARPGAAAAAAARRRTMRVASAASCDAGRRSSRRSPTPVAKWERPGTPPAAAGAPEGAAEGRSTSGADSRQGEGRPAAAGAHREG